MPMSTGSHSTETVAAMPATRAVLIAASAGGFAPLRRILAALPPELPAAVVIVMHRSAQGPHLLAQVFSRVSRLPVRNAAPGERMCAGVVYLAPADQHLVLGADRSFAFSDGRRIRHVRSSANPLFESAGRVLGKGAIAVVLSGMGGDGTDGVQAVKSGGGTVIAQDDPLFYPMPASAIQTGAVDLVLPADQIAPTLVRLLAENHAPEIRPS
jgi:two-component system chemotaxis response regulator CheB